jgi:hypothetical protein
MARPMMGDPAPEAPVSVTRDVIDGAMLPNSQATMSCADAECDLAVLMARSVWPGLARPRGRWS